MTDRKKSDVAFWATGVVVGLPALYLLSFGPWLWSVPEIHWMKSDPYMRGYGFYLPADTFADYGPVLIARPYDAYLCWWVARRE
jgi:hypothetical protein